MGEIGPDFNGISVYSPVSGLHSRVLIRRVDPTRCEPAIHRHLVKSGGNLSKTLLDLPERFRGLRTVGVGANRGVSPNCYTAAGDPESGLVAFFLGYG